MTFRYYFYSSYLLSLFYVYSTSYFYGEWDSHFQNNMILNIDIYFKPSSNGVILYAMDSVGNQLLVKTGENLKKKTFICYFNDLSFIKPRDYFTFGYVTDLEFKSNSLYESKNLMLPDALNRKRLSNENITNYPIHKTCGNETNKTNKLCIWVGNIEVESYNEKNNTVYQPLEPEMNYCIGYFRINNINITFNEHGFFPLCSKLYNETICDRENCSIVKKRLYIFDCSFSTMNNGKHCVKGLTEYIKKNNYFARINKNDETVRFKLIWKQRVLQNCCLLNILLKNKVVLLVYVNKDYELLMLVNNSQKPLKLFDHVAVESVHILLFEFSYPNISIKISNGMNFKIFIEPFHGYPNHISVGFSSNSEEICQTFKGETDFLYDSNQFQRQSAKKNEIWLYILIIIILVTFSLAMIGIAYQRKKKIKENGNIYEEKVYGHKFRIRKKGENFDDGSGIYDNDD